MSALKIAILIPLVIVLAPLALCIAAWGARCGDRVVRL